jgi:hypothetical protein
MRATIRGKPTTSSRAWARARSASVDGTSAEQAQALSGNGPCQFVERDPRGGDYRATTEGHHIHVHFDRRSDRSMGATRDFIEKEPARLA